MSYLDHRDAIALLPWLRRVWWAFWAWLAKSPGRESPREWAARMGYEYREVPDGCEIIDRCRPVPAPTVCSHDCGTRWNSQYCDPDCPFATGSNNEDIEAMREVIREVWGRGA